MATTSKKSRRSAAPFGTHRIAHLHSSALTQRVLDVAAGNGNATLAAARRFADVVSTDYVGALLERNRERAEADRLKVTFQQADAEDLSVPDASFDVVLSTFDVMFTPNQEKAASELIRVCRPGGKIGLANWTPEGFIGRLFKIIGKYVPPAPGVKSPALWGTKAHLDTMFGSKASVAAESRTFAFRYKSPKHWLELFRGYDGPVLRAFAAIDPKAREALEADLNALLGEFNVAEDGTLVAPERVFRDRHHQEGLIFEQVPGGTQPRPAGPTYKWNSAGNGFAIYGLLGGEPG